MDGTKTEMERLLKDAQKLTGIKYDIKNLGDVYQAIHVIQEELKITGTTAAEAEKTLTGSIASTKAAWENFLSGSGDLGQVVESAGVALDNIIRIVDEAVPTIANQISEHLPQLVELGIKLIGSIGEGILKNMPTLMKTMGEIISTLAKTLEQNGPQIMSQGIEYMINFINGLSSRMPEIMSTATRIIMGLVTAITDHLPDIVQAAINLAVGIGLRTNTGYTRNYREIARNNRFSSFGFNSCYPSNSSGCYSTRHRNRARTCRSSTRDFSGMW